MRWRRSCHGGGVARGSRRGPRRRPEAAGPADYVVAWKPPPELFVDQPAPRAIFNLGAGVDALLATPTLPEAVPIFRLEDAGMAEQMAEYATWVVLGAYREFAAARQLVYNARQGSM